MRQVYERIVKWFYNLRERDPLKFNELFIWIKEEANVMVVNCEKHYIGILYNKDSYDGSGKVLFSIDSAFEIDINAVISLHHSLLMRKRSGWEKYLDLNFFRELERIGLCKITILEGGGMFCMLLLEEPKDDKLLPRILS